jgi:hypothetical protein
MNRRDFLTTAAHAAVGVVGLAVLPFTGEEKLLPPVDPTRLKYHSSVTEWFYLKDGKLVKQGTGSCVSDYNEFSLEMTTMMK